MLILSEWERKTFRVKSVQITRTNMDEIAVWTGGEVLFPVNGRPYVQIPCGSKKDNSRGYVNDWVTSLITYNDGTEPEEPNFRVYQQKPFLQAFRQIAAKEETYVKIHEKLLNLTRAQDRATYFGDGQGDVMLLVQKMAKEICDMVQP